MIDFKNTVTKKNLIKDHKIKWYGLFGSPITLPFFP